MAKYRILLLRRGVQLGILLLYFGANAWGWEVLSGTLSSSKVFGVIPLADPLAVAQMFFAGIVVAADLAVGAMLVFFFYFFAGGRAFCSWVCPMNMVSEAALFVRRRVFKNRTWDIRISKKSRFGMLALALLLSFVTATTAFELISPIAVLTRSVVFGAGFALAIVAAIFVLDTFFVKNGWCGHLCPLGALYSLIGKYNYVRIFYDKQKCSECMECKSVCPEPHSLSPVAKESGVLKSGDCTLCGKCVENCGDKALGYVIK